jgi:2'-5' RNA ligase
MMAKRVVVIFPKFERLDLIEQIRSVFDPLAASVKAHITLVPPFEDDVSSEQLHSHIEQAIKDIQPFHITLQGITGHEGEYLFLNVKRGTTNLSNCETNFIRVL